MSRQNTLHPPQTLMGHYGGFASRLVAFSVDTIIISVSTFFITWFFSITAAILQLRSVLGVVLRPLPILRNIFDYVFSIELGTILLILWVASYHIFFLIVAGQTPGKALIGLRVVPLKGGKVSWWRAIVRYLGYFVSGIFFLGFFWILFDDRRQAWHDKIAGTCVIYTWPAKPDERFLAQQIREMEDRNSNNQ